MADDVKPNGWDRFVAWDLASRDTITVQRLYIDLAGDLVAGVLLSALIDWYLPESPQGGIRLQNAGTGVYDHGRWWLMTSRDQWWDECRITPEQFDAACDLLCTKGFVMRGTVTKGDTKILCLHLDLTHMMRVEHEDAWWKIPWHSQGSEARHDT
jgi:hypothetical protein